MNMIGEQVVPATRIVVWHALNDPTVLKECIPGCTFLDKQDENVLVAKCTLRIGPIRANFTGHVTFADIIACEGYAIKGEGQGGIAGFAKGSAKVRLEDEGDNTRLFYTANADIGGKLAQLGSRLIDSTAKKFAGEFFEKLAVVISLQRNLY